MIKLYVKTHCPFSARSILALASLIHESEKGQGYQIVYVDKDEDGRAELVEFSGDRKVPFLLDEENGIAMGESREIVEYLKAYFGKSV